MPTVRNNSPGSVGPHFPHAAARSSLDCDDSGFSPSTVPFFADAHSFFHASPGESSGSAATRLETLSLEVQSPYTVSLMIHSSPARELVELRLLFMAVSGGPPSELDSCCQGTRIPSGEIKRQLDYCRVVWKWYGGEDTGPTPRNAKTGTSRGRV